MSKRWDDLAKRLPKNQPLIGAEIGVWRGAMASRMLEMFPQLTLHLIDSWETHTADSEYAKSGDRIAQASASKMADAEHICREQCAFAGSRAVYHHGDSVAMAAEIPDESLDYVFIDGDHSFFGCYRDLRAWWPKVKIGGIVSGHDYEHERFVNFGVQQAVDKWLQRKPDTGGDHTWFVRKEPLYKIAGVAFGEQFQPLVQMFERSAEANAANAEIEIVEGQTPERKIRYENKWIDNTYKLHLWQQIVHGTDKPLVLCDTDTIIRGDLWSAFTDNAFDVAITERPHPSWFNGGVVFVRPTAAARRFFDRWVEWNDKLYADLPALLAARRKHYGMNQTSMVQMLEQEGPKDCRLIKLPCATWNNCDVNWKAFDPATCKILHVKSELQRVVLRRTKLERISKDLRAAAEECYRWILSA